MNFEAKPLGVAGALKYPNHPNYNQRFNRAVSVLINSIISSLSDDVPATTILSEVTINPLQIIERVKERICRKSKVDHQLLEQLPHSTCILTYKDMKA